MKIYEVLEKMSKDSEIKAVSNIKGGKSLLYISKNNNVEIRDISDDGMIGFPHRILNLDREWTILENGHINLGEIVHLMHGLPIMVKIESGSVVDDKNIWVKLSDACIFMRRQSPLELMNVVTTQCLNCRFRNYTNEEYEEQ